MDKKQQSKNGPKKAPKKPQSNKKIVKIRIPLGPRFLVNFLTTIIIFLVLVSVYSSIAGTESDIKEVSISEIATSVSLGEIKEITVKGDKINAVLIDDSKIKSVKETGSSLTDTLVNYGVKLDEIEGLSIKVEDDSNFWLVALNIGGFLLPLLFIGFFFWFLTRQAKGQGMQAFTFGQSRAKIIDPNDKSQKITFRDVAGAKEAKEELLEIVDFLRQPKKFLDIGAQIPKGVILMGAPGTGKCIVGDSLVLTNKGLIEIKDIPKYFWVNPKNNDVKGAILPTFDVIRVRDTDQEASHWYDLGMQETKKIILQQGVEIEGTYEHPIVVMNEDGYLEFRKLENLKEGDSVAIKFGTGAFGVSNEVNSEQSYIMGLLTGDGNLSHSSRIGFTSVDEELVSSFKGYIKNNYPDTPIGLATDGITHTVTSWAVKKDLYEAGMSYLLSYDKVIPPFIMQAPKHVIIAFLQGLFDADGYFSRYSFGYSTVSKKLSDQVMITLINLGIVPQRRLKNEKDNKHPRPVYEITVSGTELEKFSREVGFRLTRKQEQMVKYLDEHNTGNTNVDVFFHISQIVDRSWRELSDKGLSKEGLSKLAHKNRTRKRISRQTLTEFIDAFKINGLHTEDTVYLESLLRSNLFFSPVSKIEKGYSRVYDFTVPKTHSFISNGLISHNTLLARAVAGEAKVPFFSISGSEFVEMFVGVGASRVRDLFKLAKKSAPAIIFVDEIDAVGRVRGTGVGGGNDEREQTLNQILVEMDGFEQNEKVIVMAATNRPDVLDPALLRPGRFDRRVTIDLPDIDDREAILGVHVRNKPMAEDVALRIIAERTPGFSGADLYSLVNEAAILAAREDRKTVSQYDFIRAIEKVLLGPERRSHLLSKKEKEITAYHEAGHALVASVLPDTDPVHKISIISRGRAAGYTLHLPIVERKFKSKKEFIADLAVTLGGYVVEQLVFGDITTGPSNDLQVATARARDMVTLYGMSDSIGPVALESDSGRVLFGNAPGSKDHSEKVAGEIDAEVSRLMREAKETAHKIVTENRALLNIIAKSLIEEETLERAEFDAILRANGVTPKRDVDPILENVG
ncbi:hypothetical protein COW81_01935 [Candidatus Campbellbacteria bacterium CG22_combo_CG10-13_8_21_14_all_36_13]|uniref:ATP-dependent zinc metalloprotease FtsH n=1 Tax=Candidatus Campbellbacteria bacterium CG22_combo_CG10-13_8_21_14_all_36_13 TaxID=1974529 RepID=A0A2H0DZN8_9BACT|nr:MAG: hypothetical protein COW81_01935 [Candidatus Campbellbacteria bacterium CG22_combo_CG10-13_8_21_14_all_36_13]